MLIARDCAGRVAILHWVERRGAEPLVHRYSREDEIVYVLEGELTYYVDAETHTTSAGTCVSGAGDRAHLRGRDGRGAAAGAGGTGRPGRLL